MCERTASRANLFPDNFPLLVRSAIRWFFTFHFVCASWIFFRAPSLEASLSYLGGLSRATIEMHPPSLFVLLLMIAGALTQIISPRIFDSVIEFYTRLHVTLQVALSTGVLFLISVMSPSGVPAFIYFQF